MRRPFSGGSIGDPVQLSPTLIGDPVQLFRDPGELHPDPIALYVTRAHKQGVTLGGYFGGVWGCHLRGGVTWGGVPARSVLRW